MKDKPPLLKPVARKRIANKFKSAEWETWIDALVEEAAQAQRDSDIDWYARSK